MSTPKYSILLPTRNGIQYLPYAIQTVLSQDYLDFELIVSDNNSTDGTYEYISKISDPRFRFIKQQKTLSMVDHFEFILGEAKGVWVTALGDDDGLMPHFFERLEKLCFDNKGVEAVVFRRAYYFWPGCEELYGDQVVAYDPVTSSSAVNNKWSIFLCIASIINYTEVPQLYTSGLVKRSYIDRIKRSTGEVFFHGFAPDAASAVALALSSSKHYRFEEPLFWTGTSPKSTGYSQISSIQKEQAAEFDDLNINNVRIKANVLPEAITKKADFAVLFYGSLLQYPNLPRFWKSKFIRNFFIAGLILKSRQNIEWISEGFGLPINLYALSPYMFCLRFIRDRFEKSKAAINQSNNLTAIFSSDRNSYPTLKEAYEHVRLVHDRV